MKAHQFSAAEIREEGPSLSPEFVVQALGLARREPASAERTHIENKIAEKRRQIAQLAQDIRWLTMELES